MCITQSPIQLKCKNNFQYLDTKVSNSKVTEIWKNILINFSWYSYKSTILKHAYMYNEGGGGGQKWSDFFMKKLHLRK